MSADKNDIFYRKAGCVIQVRLCGCTDRREATSSEHGVPAIFVRRLIYQRVLWRMSVSAGHMMKCIQYKHMVGEGIKCILKVSLQHTYL